GWRPVLRTRAGRARADRGRHRDHRRSTRRRVRASRRRLHRTRTGAGHRDGRDDQRVEPHQRDRAHGNAAPLILERVQTTSGAQIDVDGDVVTKLHRPGTDQLALTTRLRTAAESGSLLSPLTTIPERVGDRWRTSWPKVKTVVPQPECVPWAEAAA